MTISEYISQFKRIADEIKCRDGFRISVQGSPSHYSNPRNGIGPWTHVECGFPSHKPELIMEYAESADNPTQTVYGYVPVELVESLIAMHGGSKQLDEKESTK